MAKKQSKPDLAGRAAILTAVGALITALGGLIAVALTNSAALFPQAPAPTPTPAVIDTMNSVSNWTTYTDTAGSTLSLGLTSDTTNGSLKMDFDLKPYGYVGIAKDINTDRLAQGTGIRFAHQGSGMANTLELKLVYGTGTVFSVAWHATTSHADWEALEALYGDFKCWPDTGPRDVTDPDYCPPAKTLRLDVAKVARLDFAISNKPELGDHAGSGQVVIENVVDAQ